MTISFTVFGNAKPKGSTRPFCVNRKQVEQGQRPVIVTTGNNPNAKEWQQLVSMTAQQHRPDTLYQGAVEIGLHFYFARPKSVSVKKRPYHTVKPDIDKLCRNILDALSGVVYVDDTQVVKLTASKAYDQAPRVEITVREVE